MAIKIFFHICAITRAETVVKDIIRSIHFSGLYDDTEKIYCYISGEPEMITTIISILNTSGSKFSIIKCVPNDTSYERLTLEDIHNHIDKTDKLLYLHTKGVSYQYENNINITNCIDDWTYLMLYHLVRHYKMCLEKLDYCHLVGCLYNKDVKHFSGNFWWSRGDYFLTLPTSIGPDYFDPELEFICTKDPIVYDIYSSDGTDLYYTRYQPYKYVDNTIDKIQN